MDCAPGVPRGTYGTMKRPVFAWLTVLAIAGCSGGDDDDGTVVERDGGVERDSGIFGPDGDGDAWTDDVDNCPAVANPEQRDRDGDGFGDLCDSCPATPNGGVGAQAGQDECVPIDESEPNDLEGMGEALTLEPNNFIKEVRGTIEEATGNGQPFDRFSVMVAAGTLLEVRVARTTADSLLEPFVAISGGAFTRARTAHGLFVARREVYVAEAGTYEIAVADRRGIDGEPRGADVYGYALSVRALPIEEVPLTLPVERQAYEIEDQSVRIFSTTFAMADFTQVVTETDLGRLASTTGVDTVLFVEVDGMVIESDDLTDGYSDSRVILEIMQDTPARIVLDHIDVTGDDREVRLSVEQPDRSGELEPNDTEDLATELVVPGVNAAQINAPLDIMNGPPDVDWFYHDGVAGQVLSINGLIGAAQSVNPAMGLSILHENGEREFLYTNFDSSGIAPKIEAVLPETRRYYLLVVHEDNLGMPDAFLGGDLFNYEIFAEILFRPPVGGTFSSTATQTLPGEINPGGNFRRHFVESSSPSVVCFESNNAPDMTPYIRVYGPNHMGQYGQGEERAMAYLPTADRYIAAVHNSADGEGGPGITYELDATIIPTTGVEEVEPNDGSGQPTVLTGPVAAGIGTLETPADVDFYRFTTTGPVTLHVVMGQGSFGREIQLRNSSGGVLFTGFSEAWDLDLTDPDDYLIRVSSEIAGPYTLIVKAE